MRSYRGVLIGGPLDGKWIIHTDRIYHAIHMEAIPVRTPSEPVPEMMNYTEHRYRFNPIPGYFHDEFGVFIHHGLSFEKAMAMLVMNYRPLEVMTGGDR